MSTSLKRWLKLFLVEGDFGPTGGDVLEDSSRYNGRRPAGYPAAAHTMQLVLEMHVCICVLSVT